MSGDRHKSGISRQIMQGAGPDFEKDMRRFGAAGKPYLINGYRLSMRKIKNVWHLQTEGLSPEPFQRALNEMFRILADQPFLTISLNSMNAAQFKIPYVRLAHQLVKAIKGNQSTVEKTIKIVDFNSSYLQSVQEVFHAHG